MLCFHRSLPLCLSVLLSACTLGPDFAPPPAPATSAYLPADEAKSDVLRGRISGAWWTLFRSPQLDAVVKQALADSPTLERARATLAQAHELVTATSGAEAPQVNGAAAVQRERANMAAYGLSGDSPVFNLYSVGPTVSYALDLFGGTRRHIEESAARAEQAGYQLDGAYLTLTGAVVDQALVIASLRAQIAAVETVLAEDRKNVDLVRTAKTVGTATEVDILNAESQLDADRPLLPPLRQQLAAARHALSRLVGRAPADWTPPDFELDAFAQPDPVPLSLPAELVHQRPDILAAEADLHATSAAIGVATANEYPSLTLSADLTQAAFFPAKLWSDAASGAVAGLGLTAPLFDGGTRAAERRAAEDAYRASLADYRQVVVNSFTQVADLLTAIDHDNEELTAQDTALATARRSLSLSRESYAAGNVGILSVLDAERQADVARLGRIRADERRRRDAAQLLLAMGGGWWNWDQAARGPATAALAR